MATIDDIRAALQVHLPADLHAHIPVLAQVLARLSDDSLSQEEAQRRLAEPAFAAALRALAGQHVPLVGGDYITVGNVTDSKAIAAGAGAVAIGDVVIHIHTRSSSNQQAAPSRTPPPGVTTTPDYQLPPLHTRTRLSIGGKSYFIQQVLQEHISDTVVARLARARDESMNRDIVIKQLEARHNRGAAEVTLNKVRTDARFWADAARTCANLPNVLEIHDAAGTIWIVSEWISGRPLSQLYPASGPLPNRAFVDQIVRDMLDVCDAMAALHTKRLLHLTITPDNIVHASGRRGLVLVDLILGGDPQRGESGMLGFQAPEQTRTRPAGTFPKPTTDIYGFGATLYFLLTHRLPAAVQSGPQPPPSANNPAVPVGLDEIVLNALARNPDKRFARADDLKYALRSSLQRKRND